MASRLQFEAWTSPTSPTFEKLFDIGEATDDTGGALEGSTGLVQLSAWSDNTLLVPAAYDRLKDLVTPSTGCLVRVFNDDTLVDEFFTERVPKKLTRPAAVPVTGRQINGIVEWCAVYPFRYPDDAPGAQDWHWGALENLLTNPSFEDNPLGLANPGAETGLVGPWWAGAVAGVHANLTVDTVAPRSGTFHWIIEALIDEGGKSTTVKVEPGRSYRFGVHARTDTGSAQWEVGASGPETMLPGPGAAIRPHIGSFEGTFEAYVRETFTTSYADKALEFTAGPDQTSVQLNVRSFDGNPNLTLYTDDLEWAGFGIGIDGWSYTPGVIDFQASQDVTPTDGDWVARIICPPGEGIFQGVTGIVEGETVTVDVDVLGPSADLWALELRDLRGAVLAQASVTLSWSPQLVQLAGVTLPTFLPGAEPEVQVWLVNRSTVTSTCYADNFHFHSGLPAASATEIVRLLVEAAQARGTFGFLDLDFTDSLDTAGVAVTPISFSAFFGANGHLGQVLRDLKTMGYDWRILAKDTPVGPLTHDLQLWAPGSGPGDLTATPGGPSVLAGGHVTDGEVVDRIPPFTTLLVHGAGPLRLEETNAVTEAAMGRLEQVVDAEAVSSIPGLQAVANARFGGEETNREALTATVLGTDQTVPLVAYTPGNTIWWQFPGLTPKVAKKVDRVGWVHKNITEYQLQGSQILTSEGALANAVDMLLQEFKRRRTTGRQARRSMAPLVNVPSQESVGAHVHASATTQTIPSGGATVEWAVEEIPNLQFGTLTYPLTEYEIRVAGYYDIWVDLSWDTWDGGGTVEIVRTRASVPEVVWPIAATAPGVWAAGDGKVFTPETAPAIPCLPGDLISVVVDHGDGSGKDLATATLVIDLVDRTPIAIPPTPEPPPLPVWIFLEDGTFHTPGDVSTVDVWIIGAGGHGGSTAGTGRAGGGGAGQVVELVNYPVSGSIPVVVGEPAIDTGDPGGSSSFDGQTALGGGRGAHRFPGVFDGQDGGSGGGGGVATGFTGVGGDAVSTGGHDGGNAAAGTGTSRAGGGGGGAGAPGGNAVADKGGSGGIGVDLSHVVGLLYGENGWFAGGGAGFCETSSGGPGLGGGGVWNGPGQTNTGGGGGGWGSAGFEQPGGSGIVIVRKAS